MSLKRIEKAQTLWKPAVDNISGIYINAEAELEFRKRLLNFFQIGDYFMAIFNLVELRLEYTTEGIHNVLGYAPEDFTFSFFLSLMHPDDEIYFLTFEKKIVELFEKMPTEERLNYKVRYDYRLRCKNGSYKRLMHQMMITEINEEEAKLKTLIVFTDITEYKPSGTPVLSLIGLNGRPSFCNIGAETEPDENSKSFHLEFTERERQILALIAVGCSSKEISEQLFISKHTVDTHRKNILRKSPGLNLNQLIALAIKEGYI